MNKSRIFYFDELRALAIIGILFCHASIYFVSNTFGTPDFCISAFFDCFRDFSIPIFVMISGALLLNKNDSFMKFFKRRLSRILIPFLFWVMIYIIYTFVLITHEINWSLALDIFLGTAGTLGVAFWFIWMIILAYLGIFIINKIIVFGSQKHDKFDRKFIAFLTMLSLLYIISVQFKLIHAYDSKITYFISFMSYIIIGYFLANNDFLESKISPKIVSLIAFIIFAGSYCYYIFGYVVPKSILNGHFTFLGYFNIQILFISTALFLFFKYLSKCDFSHDIENRPLGKSISAVSRYSFGIYLAHYMVLNYLKINIIKYVNFSHQSPLIWIPLFVVLTLAISLAILWILNKIPYLNKVSGLN